ncbi:MAG: hypothetical protein JJU36_05580 [Phycisphaeraceae bacterium]|nr:hypothetical protein [Phycisphaeraceae bacterium]
MADWLDRLDGSLTQADRPLVRFKNGPGELAVCVHGARIVGCAIQGVDENLFYHQRGLENPEQAPGFLKKAGADIGGDRLWIAPEVAFMWPDLAGARIDPFGTYDLPAKMDPGHWEVEASGRDWIELTAAMDLVDHRSSAKVSLRAMRTIALGGLPDDWPEALPALAFTCGHQLSVLRGDASAWVGIWHLLQMPVGGTLVCPTVAPTSFPPTDYYSPFRPEDVTVKPEAVHFHARGDSIIKMGLRAEDVTGRMAYIRSLGDGRSSAILRGFLPQPGQPYIDVPRSFDALLGGDALQAFCSDQGTQGFTEMEYHEPGLKIGSGRTRTSGGCWTIVTAGQQALVEQTVQRLLGVSVST